MYAGVADDDQKRHCEGKLSDAKIILEFGTVEKAHDVTAKGVIWLESRGSKSFNIENHERSIREKWGMILNLARPSVEQRNDIAAQTVTPPSQPSPQPSSIIS
jgi:hypothetical protein